MQLASRSLASYNALNSVDCTFYVSQVADTATTKITCDAYDFGNLIQLQTFVNATWYGDFYKASFMTALNFDATQFDKFFDTSVENTFGYNLAMVNKNNSDHYACTPAPSSPNNCTAD